MSSLENTQKWAEVLQSFPAFKHCNDDAVREIGEEILIVNEDIEIVKGIVKLSKGVKIPKTFTTMTCGLVDVIEVNKPLLKRRKTCKKKIISEKIQNKKPSQNQQPFTKDNNTSSILTIEDILQKASFKCSNTSESIALLVRALISLTNSTPTSDTECSDVTLFLSQKANSLGKPTLSMIIKKQKYYFSKFNESEVLVIEPIWMAALQAVLSDRGGGTQCVITENFIIQLELSNVQVVETVVSLFSDGEINAVHQILEKKKIHAPKLMSILANNHSMEIPGKKKKNNNIFFLNFLNSITNSEPDKYISARFKLMNPSPVHIKNNLILFLLNFNTSFNTIQQTRFFNISSSLIDSIEVSTRNKLVHATKIFIKNQINKLKQNSVLTARSDVGSYSVMSTASKIENEILLEKEKILKDLDLCLATSFHLLYIATDDCDSVIDFEIPTNMKHTREMSNAIKRQTQQNESDRVIGIDFLQKYISKETPSLKVSSSVMYKTVWFWHTSVSSIKQQQCISSSLIIDSYHCSDCTTRFDLGMQSVVKMSLQSSDCFSIGIQAINNIINNNLTENELQSVHEWRRLMESGN